MTHPFKHYLQKYFISLSDVVTVCSNIFACKEERKHNSRKEILTTNLFSTNFEYKINK